MDNFEPEAERTIRDVATIKVLADRRRLRILELLQEPGTVKEVATALEEPPSKLYYHVNLLEAHDLIRVVGHNLESGMVEKIYQVTARQLRLTNPLLMGEQLSADSTAALLLAMVDEAREHLPAGLLRRDPSSAPPRYPFVTVKQLRLSESQLATFHRRLAELVADVTREAENNDAESDADPFELAITFYRLDDQE